MWTSEEKSALRAHYLDGMRRAGIADAMQKTEASVREYLYRLTFSAEEKEQRRNNRVQFRNRNLSSTRVGKEHPITVPANIILERNCRLAVAPRDLTAAMMGDPRPGYSALERRV